MERKGKEKQNEDCQSRVLMGFVLRHEPVVEVTISILVVARDCETARWSARTAWPARVHETAASVCQQITKATVHVAGIGDAIEHNVLVYIKGES